MSIPFESSMVGPMHGPRRILVWALAALVLAGMVAAMVWAVGYVSSDRFLEDAVADIGLQLGAIDSVGSLVGGRDRAWWIGPVVVFGVVMALECAVYEFTRAIRCHRRSTETFGSDRVETIGDEEHGS